MKNKWKTGFLLLLGINLLIVVIIISLIMIPSTNNERINNKEPINDNVSFHVKSNKNDLNQVINHYLKKEASDSPIDYHVHLGNEVEFYGVLPIFSKTLNMKLTFEPKALSNGDLALKQKSISIGSLDLPVSYVLQYISENYKLPKGVVIQPNNKLIYIHMQQLKLKSDLKIKVNKFDLKKDDIAFTIQVPVK
ncbi:YpmS family protein [Neobacillus ginsengisoli]|uniref:Uncharacterized protein YpmS n=1 Tax=Neobacillus ginsengisoli TaxID=904295 RepID=A0ABT9XQ10_9BACI|nr:YpmS family protein [Neobacillus ginsengisoli]MDQ0197628.1 uncharacterized protein YpmS [Neobacillus ginsengisoli]